MTTMEMMKLQRTLGAGVLMDSAREYKEQAAKDFMTVAAEEYASISRYEINEGTEKLWEAYQSSLDMVLPEKDGIITDKAKDELEWKELVAMQEKKRKLLEEMLIKRRLFELERISAVKGVVGESKLTYLEGVSAAELLSMIM